MTEVTHTEITFGKLRYKVTTIIEHDEKVAEEAEEFIALCVARNLLKKSGVA